MAHEGIKESYNMEEKLKGANQPDFVVNQDDLEWSSEGAPEKDKFTFHRKNLAAATNGKVLGYSHNSNLIDLSVIF
ncbi:hypothetical protein JYT44_00825 [Caldithrix abyssi]|nr:hypothetical protein [Caldithrix abyssi]